MNTCDILKLLGACVHVVLPQLNGKDVCGLLVIGVHQTGTALEGIIGDAFPPDFPPGRIADLLRVAADQLEGLHHV